MRILILVVSLLISGVCSATEVHHIDGAKSNFCLPDVNKVDDVPWAPLDKSGTPDSFAFAGCETISAPNNTKCAMPDSIVGGVVLTKSRFRSQKWVDAGAKSMLKLITLSPDAKITSTDGGGTIVVYNPKLWERDWYVWAKAKSLSNGSRPHLDNDDILIATCRNQNVSIPAAASKTAAVECDRWVLGSDYALQYTFKSNAQIPQAIKALDTAMMTTIDNWRCNGHNT